MKRRFILFMVLVIFSSCSFYDNYYGYKTELDNNRELWNSTGIGNYNYRVFICHGESPVHGYYNLTVHADTLHLAEYDTSIKNWQIPSDTVPLYIIKCLPTIDNLFATIEWAIERRADEITIEYDSIYGYPKDVRIDWVIQAVDDEEVFEVYGFTPI